MLKVLIYSKKNSLKRLEIFLNKRKSIQKNKTSAVIKIIRNVRNANKLLKSSQLFVLSSRYEGFGNVLIEAGLNKVPIISSNCNHGPKEILANGKYGDLFNVGNHKELASKIKKFIRKPDVLNLKSIKFFNSLHRFKTQKIIDKYEKVFFNV